MDQAVGFFGQTVEQELEAAENKVRSRKGKVRESQIRSARMNVLKKYGISSQQPRQFADPASMI